MTSGGHQIVAYASVVGPRIGSLSAFVHILVAMDALVSFLTNTLVPGIEVGTLLRVHGVARSQVIVGFTFVNVKIAFGSRDAVDAFALIGSRQILAGGCPRCVASSVKHGTLFGFAFVYIRFAKGPSPTCGLSKR